MGQGVRCKRLWRKKTKKIWRAALCLQERLVLSRCRRPYKEREALFWIQKKRDCEGKI